MKPSAAVLIIMITIFTVLLPGSLSAQAIWLGPRVQKGISLEILKPSFENNPDISFLTSTLFLSGYLPLSARVSLTAELPLTHFGLDSNFADASETAVGNPYIGIVAEARDAPLFIEAGVRVPLAPDGNDALFSGLYADFDRYEAFLPNVLSALFLFNYVYSQTPSGFSLRLRGGPSLLIPTREGGDAELIAHYSLQGWYVTERVDIGAGVTGLAVITEGDLSLGERTFHHVGLAAIGHIGTVAPGVHLRVPLDDNLGEMVNFIFGLSVTVHLR